MVSEIRIYVEGGGDSAHTKREIRRGFGEFLKALCDLARERNMGWHVIACSSRNSTFDDFKTALKTHPKSFNVLLVDSEEPLDLANGLWAHLKQRDEWQTPDLPDEHCHLMVRAMEAWLIADLNALQKYYRQGFRPNALPKNPNTEDVPKTQLASALKEATRHTQKGEYHKTRHAPDLLASVDVAKVRNAAEHCERLFATLTQTITGQA